MNLKKIPVKFGRVRGGFDCSSNSLTSLQGAPKEVGDDFDCSTNEKEFSEQDVKKVSNVEGDIYV